MTQLNTSLTEVVRRQLDRPVDRIDGQLKKYPVRKTIRNSDAKLGPNCVLTSDNMKVSQSSFLQAQ